MPEHETLPGTGQPTRDRGLWDRYVVDGRIVHGAWMHACATRSYVGACRRCGDHLVPERPVQVAAGRFDYEARCCRGGCGWTCNAPDGRVFARSSRSSERIKGER